MDISSCGCTCTNGPMSNHLPSKWMVRSQEHLYKASTYKRRGSQNCRIPYVHKLSNENANVYKFYFWCKMSSWHKQILKCFKYTLVHSGAASTFHRLVQMMVSEKCHKPEVGRGQIPDISNQPFVKFKFNEVLNNQRPCEEIRSTSSDLQLLLWVAPSHPPLPFLI